MLFNEIIGVAIKEGRMIKIKVSLGLNSGVTGAYAMNITKISNDQVILFLKIYCINDQFLASKIEESLLVRCSSFYTRPGVLSNDFLSDLELQAEIGSVSFASAEALSCEATYVFDWVMAQPLDYLFTLQT